MVSDNETMELYMQSLRERWVKAIQNDQDWDVKVKVHDKSGCPDGGSYKFVLEINQGRSTCGEVEVDDRASSFESEVNEVPYEPMFKQSYREKGFNEIQIEEFWQEFLDKNPQYQKPDKVPQE